MRPPRRRRRQPPDAPSLAAAGHLRCRCCRGVCDPRTLARRTAPGGQAAGRGLGRKRAAPSRANRTQQLRCSFSQDSLRAWAWRTGRWADASWPVVSKEEAGESGGVGTGVMRADVNFAETVAVERSQPARRPPEPPASRRAAFKLGCTFPLSTHYCPGGVLSDSLMAYVLQRLGLPNLALRRLGLQ